MSSPSFRISGDGREAVRTRVHRTGSIDFSLPHRRSVDVDNGYDNSVVAKLGSSPKFYRSNGPAEANRSPQTPPHLQNMKKSPGSTFIVRSSTKRSNRDIEAEIALVEEELRGRLGYVPTAGQEFSENANSLLDLHRMFHLSENFSINRGGLRI